MTDPKNYRCMKCGEWYDNAHVCKGIEPPSGVKHDGAKPRMDLLDPYAVEQLAEVLTFGAKKYAAHNWREGLHKSRLIAAALRHLFAYLGGQDKDPETGLSHAAHAMCCCMFLLGLEHRPELDDRWKAK